MGKDKKSGVTNTTLDPKPEWTMGGNPKAIEAQEAAGQAELVSAEVLPTDMRGEREAFEKMGLQFGDLVEGDPIFTHVTLPPGWKKEATDHAMWSRLVDDRGRVRAKIFYKAAFYDRSAHMGASARLSIEGIYDKDNTTSARVCDGDVVLFETEELSGSEDGMYDLRQQVREAAVQWLDQNLPEWNDPSAYWDVDDLKTLIGS